MVNIGGELKMSYRCVDWSKEKADERVRKGKNAIDHIFMVFLGVVRVII